jgi:ATP-binding cassette subfamily B multidrug efflux pump
MGKNDYTIGQVKTAPTRGPMGGRGPGRMAGSGEKAKDFKKAWGQLIAYNKPQMPAIAVAILCASGGSILALVGPNKLRDITNLITEGFMTGIDLTAVVKICVTLVIIYACSFLLSFSQGFIMATVTQVITKKLRSDVSHKINKVPIWYYNKTSYGDVLSRVTNDVDAIGQTLNQSIGMLVSAVTLFLGSLVMMLTTNVLMALTAVASTILGFSVMIIIISKSQKYFAIQQQNLGAMNGHVEEVYAGHNVVKAYNGEKAAKQEFDKINEKLCDSAFKSQFLSGLMMPLMTFIGNFGYVAVCVVGAALAIKGTITFGVIVAFMLYIRLFTQPLSQFAQAATSLQSTAAASERVFQFLDEEEMADESQKETHLADVKGEVEFRNVRFGYEDSDVTVIHDFSAKAKPGQKVAIVGPTGAGKTTIVNLLMRFHEIQGGEILIDGTSTKELTRENVHDLFCMVLQDTWLFEGTIRENIVYCKQGVSDDEVVRACKAVGIHHFIQTLPQGYDTVLRDETSLSAGQKQQITIARAMIQNAPMLILDEATSSVDTRTEVLIQQAMDKLMEGRTSFVIAHRLSTIKNADVIFVMKDGDIIESGSHEELLAKGGFYAELYNSQFEKVS